MAPIPPRWRARSSPVGPRPCLPPAHQSGCPTPPRPGWTWTPQCTGFCLLGKQLWSPHPTKAKGTASTPVLRSGASSLRSYFLLAHPETNGDLLLPSCMEPGAPGGDLGRRTRGLGLATGGDSQRSEGRQGPEPRSQSQHHAHPLPDRPAGVSRGGRGAGSPLRRPLGLSPTASTGGNGAGTRTGLLYGT